MRNLESSILSTIIDTANDHLFIVKADGRIHDVSPGAAAVYGVPREELRHSSIQELEKQGILNPPVSLRVLKTGKSEQLVQQTKTKRSVIAQAHPVYIKGELVCVVSRSMDLTDLQLLQQEYALLQERLSDHIRGGRNGSIEDAGVVSALDDLEVHSEIMCEVALMIKRVSSTDASVLMYGETGVGKTVFARQLHKWSPRKDGPFIDVNCGAIPESLFESEMFGYQQGAFSGAASKGKAGLIEMAQGGTLFLDEISELPLDVQAKLLKVIQDGNVTRLGGTSVHRVDFRLVAATNQDLWQRVESGDFRLDLYYRLNVIPITLPPLRDRKEDIPSLVDRYINKLNDRYGFEKILASDAWEELMRNDWLGNIRELENWLERAWVSSEGNMIHSQDDSVNGDGVKGGLKSKIKIDELRCREKEPSEYSDCFLRHDETLKQAVERAEVSIFKKLCSELPSTYAIARRLEISQPSVVRKLKYYGLAIKKSHDG
ncbi:sigma-54 interaction domain-containing protein [Halomonas piscis]|uniref:sigma-54 interaction domain-containing protein n=1 Tax=Halomonas piscis TaxID=3031727 RepID=UPI00289FA45C|nr:sigma 54-interacting transcriptional regulator [Halomonas piscis]